jgi:molecular chaperone GrpE (heat shock protein)
MPKLDERISGLESKLKQLKARQQRIDARARALEKRRERKDDTRRKILVGATVLARVDRDELDHADLTAWLDAHLTRDDDRALFDLPPKST